MVEAGTVVLLLLLLFLVLVTLAVALTILRPSVGDDGVLLSKVLEWAGGAFFALLTALGVHRGSGGRGGSPPSDAGGDEDGQR